jgi:hypothetical protein
MLTCSLLETGVEGELEDLFEDFNDGRVQFALAKVKDPNTGLGKNVFFAWVRHQLG